MKFALKILCLVVVAAMLTVPAFAADEKQEAVKTGQQASEQVTQYTGEDIPAPHTHMFYDADWLDKFHNPTEGVELGLDFRFREVYAENYTTLDKDFPAADNYAHYQRYRTRMSGKFNLSPDVDLNTRLVWEFFTWEKPSTRPQSTEFDEVLFDRLNFTFRNAFDMPLTIVVGRQDIILGNGWLVLEGTPADGSRTIHFDAVRATYDLQDEGDKLDLIYVQNYDKENKWLKPFSYNDARHFTQGQDERGAIVYWTNKLGPKAQTEAYYIYKEDRRSPRAAATVPNAEIHTFGGALQDAIDQNWSYRAELAKQFGQKGQTDLNAMAFNGRLKYSFNNECQSAVFMDYEYLSGDRPGTGNDEAFDTLWGDYPQAQRGGDLPIYVWVGESGNLGQMTNFHRLGFGHYFKPHEKWSLETLYNLYWADDNTLAAGATGGGGFPTYGSGRFRGQMFTAYLKYRCCAQLNAHFLVDYFVPGDFYADNSRDHGLFARFNVQYTF
ncbi:hypothetical protein STSP2_03431 [Anaerohalosphaera lusitana]|uniref:Alginate export domain-containing protein n=1 Tax=Anaerohalosphaera lusitana TaxID=1936003 RepID=A0A1U9NQX9_9BACT|nr:alginate export family protein [Anaerohalosphaera lusitana]AQT70225.1 hypothetical protein STSP2_03431 [Anaerohalosphaera lusitana]